MVTKLLLQEKSLIISPKTKQKSFLDIKSSI